MTEACVFRSFHHCFERMVSLVLVRILVVRKDSPHPQGRSHNTGTTKQWLLLAKPVLGPQTLWGPERTGVSSGWAWLGRGSRQGGVVREGEGIWDKSVLQPQGCRGESAGTMEGLFK